MSGHRRAALALHELVPADRELVLAELPEGEQRLLRGYLDELEELGFGGVAVNEVLAGEPPSSAAQVVAGADAGAVLRALDGEPAFLICALLGAQSWPWESALLAALPAHLRLRVEMMRTRSRPAAARDAFVVAAIARALGGQRAAQRPAGPPGRFGHITTWLRSWMR